MSRTYRGSDVVFRINNNVIPNLHCYELTHNLLNNQQIIVLHYSVFADESEISILPPFIQELMDSDMRGNQLTIHYSNDDGDSVIRYFKIIQLLEIKEVGDCKEPETPASTITMSISEILPKADRE